MPPAGWTAPDGYVWGNGKAAESSKASKSAAAKKRGAELPPPLYPMVAVLNAPAADPPAIAPVSTRQLRNRAAHEGNISATEIRQLGADAALSAHSSDTENDDDAPGAHGGVLHDDDDPLHNRPRRRHRVNEESDNEDEREGPGPLHPPSQPA